MTSIDPTADDLYQQLIDKYNRPFTIEQLVEDYTNISLTIAQNKQYTNAQRISLYLLAAKQSSFYDAQLWAVHK